MTARDPVLLKKLFAGWTSRTRTSRPTPMAAIAPPAPTAGAPIVPPFGQGRRRGEMQLVVHTTRSAADDPELSLTWKQMKALGVPEPGELRTSKRQPPDRADVAADRFLRYLKATQAMPMPAKTGVQLQALYEAFCRIDHREPCYINHVLGALTKLEGVKRREVIGTTAKGNPSYSRIYDIGTRRNLKRARVKRPRRQARAEAAPLTRLLKAA